MPKDYGYGPTYYLSLYKTTQRPRKCERCGQNAYYDHPDLGWLCAAHLTDLINVGEELWRWADYPEIWRRMENLLKRSSSANATDAALSNQSAINKRKLGG